MIKNKDIQLTLKAIKEYLLDEYKEIKEKEKKKRDWRTYEQKVSYRIRTVIRNLEPLIEEATKNLEIYRAAGRTLELTLKQKVTLLLIKQLVKKSNRNMAYMIDVFSLLSGIDISYKGVERLYSDKEVEMALHNLHMLLLKKKKIKNVEASGDGTGYALTITKHYSSTVTKKKDKAKRSSKQTKKAFVYSFKMIDIHSKMYLCYGTSLKSEKKAYHKAMIMFKQTDIALNSIRLDKYYSFPSHVDAFGKAKVYIIPRSDATLKGSWKWKRLMGKFIHNTLPYLSEYYKRNNSESGFSSDKKVLGWKIAQRREDRIDTADFCTELWHNLFNLYRD